MAYKGLVILWASYLESLTEAQKTCFVKTAEMFACKKSHENFNSEKFGQFNVICQIHQ